MLNGLRVSKYKKAVSPVITTVILVAVAIAISISAAYWMSGISGEYTGLEKVEIPTAYCTLNPTVNNSRWEIHLSLKNSGSNPTRIMYVMVNNMLVSEYNITAGGSLSGADSIGTSIPESGLGIESGQTLDVYVWIGEDLLSSGTSVSIDLHSVSGIDYVKLLKLL